MSIRLDQGSSDVTISPGASSSGEKKGIVSSKTIVLEILSKLGENGVDSWKELNGVATKVGIEDPKAVILHHCALEKLQMADESNYKVRNEILLEALQKGSALPKEQLASLCQLVGDAGLQKQVLEKHLKRLGVEQKEIEAWVNAITDKKGFIPKKVFQMMILCLPFIKDKSVFEGAYLTGNTPFLPLMLKVMEIEDDRGNPVLLNIGMENFIGDEYANDNEMIRLAIQNPKYLKAMAALKYGRGPRFDVKAMEKGLALFKNPKIAVAWGNATGRDEQGRLVKTYDRQELFYSLTLEEKEESLFTMIENPEAWNVDAVSLLTSSGMNSDCAELLLNKTLEPLGLESAQKNRIVKAILSASDEKHRLWLSLGPYLLTLGSEDKSHLDFSGSDDMLLISLLQAVISKKTPRPHAPITTEKLKIINSLKDGLALKWNTSLMTHSENTEAILSDLCRLNSINFDWEGTARNSWEAYSKGLFSRIEERKVSPTMLSSELAAKWEKIQTLTPEKKPVAWLTELESQGWELHQVLGRTHVFYRKEDGKFMGIKWQKSKEDVKELFKEKTTLDVIRKHQKRLGLLSEYPEPVGVFQFEGALSETYFDETPVSVKAAEEGGEMIAYVYEFPNDGYFKYLHDPKEEEEKVKVAAEYARARQALIVDLATLAKNGLIMTQLADIFHRSEGSRTSRDDRGRFMALNYLVRDYSLVPDQEGFTGVGNGRLHHLETAVKYVNAGYSGLRDVGDSELMKDLSNPEFEFSKTYFSKVMQTKPKKASAYILANFLAEFLLVYELTITERRVQHKENQLDWTEEEKLKELAGELKEGFINTMRYYGGLSHTLTKRFIDNSGIDWMMAARQLHFFSRKDQKGYVPHNKPDTLPKTVMGDSVQILGGGGSRGMWDPEKGMIDMKPGGPEVRHRGSISGVDPVKEPERGRVIMLTHLFLLEEAQKKARKLQLKADVIFSTAKGSGEEKAASEKALKLLEESLELWPYDKETFKTLEKVHTVLGNEEDAQACREQRAALVIQNAWEQHKRDKKVTDSSVGS